MIGLSLAVEAVLERAIREARGREVGGLLLERPAGGQRIQLAPNLSAEPGEFEVPVWWLDAAMTFGVRSGFEVVAFVHSHTSSLSPSERDLEEMRRMALPWIIVRDSRHGLAWSLVATAGVTDARDDPLRGSRPPPL